MVHESHITGLRKVAPGSDRSVEAGEKISGMRFQQFLSDGRRAIMIVSPLGTGAGPAVVLDIKTRNTSPITEDQVIEMRVRCPAHSVRNSGR